MREVAASSHIYNYLIKGSVGPIMLQHCYPVLTEKWEVQTYHTDRRQT